MTMTKRLVQTAGLVAGAIGALAAARPDTALGQNARRLANRLARDVRYAVGSAPGILYRLSGRRPDPDVDDDVLADRIRSALGPLEKRLDVPHVHVMVDDHIAILHGEVPTNLAAVTIEQAVKNVSGVTAVDSHLHAGLVTGDTRPSEGAAVPRPPSHALRALLDAARNAGAEHPPAAAHAVLRTFFDRVPADERAQAIAQLPTDARALVGPSRPDDGERRARFKTVPEFVAAVAAEGGVEVARATAITRAVVTALRGLIPAEASDIAAVLPADLRTLWQSDAVR